MPCGKGINSGFSRPENVIHWKYIPSARGQLANRDEGVLSIPYSFQGVLEEDVRT
jgi:hypothetical protein